MKNIKKVLLSVIFVLGLVVFLYSGFNLTKSYYGSYLDKKQTNELREKLLEKSTDNLSSVDSILLPGEKPKNSKLKDEDDIKANEKAKLKKVNVTNMKEFNKDGIGWIEIPGTTLSEPLVQGKDNEYYLWHNFYRQRYPLTGAIFLDSENNKNLQDRISFIFGHFMWDGTKFTVLKKFFDKDFYDKNKYINIYKSDGLYQYKIIGVKMILENTDLYSTDYNKKGMFLSFKNAITPYIGQKQANELKEQDKIIMLITCKAPQDSKDRRVVFAKLINR